MRGSRRPAYNPPPFPMAACSACDFEIDVDEFDVERGDELSCPECGANLQVSKVLPVELTLARDDDEENDDDEDDADDDHEPEDDDTNGADDEADDEDDGEDPDWEG